MEHAIELTVLHGTPPEHVTEILKWIQLYQTQEDPLPIRITVGSEESFAHRALAEGWRFVPWAEITDGDLEEFLFWRGGAVRSSEEIILDFYQA